ncbi:MAG TPA: ABC transporter permease [Actinomycetota bacterium]|jgi:spermidine/putrescine transport system permease protein|nr:ABC transporter permease [Actinomycetota bacterium]
MRRGRLVPFLLSLPGAIWLLVFFALPMATMLSVSFQEGSLEEGYRFTGTATNYTDAVTKYDFILWRSLLFGLIVTALTLVISYPLAYWIAFRGGRRKNLYLLLILLPFFTPYLIRTLSWKFILADSGFLLGTLKDVGILDEGFRVLATPIAVISGMTYNFLPFMALPLYVALERIDGRFLEAAQDLYSSRRETFLRVTLPLSLPGVFAGSLLTFIPAVGDYIDPEYLGGVNTTMIGQVIQREFLTSNDYPEGAAISFLLMAGILVGVFLYARALGTEEMTG